MNVVQEIFGWLLAGAVTLSLLLAFAVAACFLFVGVKSVLFPEPGVPEDDEPALSREEMREALLTALSSPAVVGRRLEAMSKRPGLRELRTLPAELEPLYVQEADR